MLYVGDTWQTPSSIYRELNRNGSGGVYTGNEAQTASAQKRLESKPCPKLDDQGLTREISAFVQTRPVS
jgi:IS30 family transposase